MKKNITIICFVFLCFVSANSQVPKGINYQGVARNATGVAIANQQLGIKISVFDSNAININWYTETHSVSTNLMGLYTIVIGKGNTLIGKFDSIDWSSGDKWIKILIDPTGGINYILGGNLQLMSVPFALYAANINTPQKLSIVNDSLLLSNNGNAVDLKIYKDNTDSQSLQKVGNTVAISNGNSIKLVDDDSMNEIQTISISNDTIALSKNGGTVKLPDNTDVVGDLLGCVFVHKYCTGDGTITNPWRSSDSSAGIKEAIKNLTPTKRIVYFKPGYYFTTGALYIDFGKLLPNLSNAYWKSSFSGSGIEFQGHMANIYVNGGSLLTGGKPGILFNWKGEHAFYWKYTGLQFYGNVDTALVQWGNGYEFPLNGCDFDITANNGFVPKNYKTTASRSSAINICWPLESRLHLVGVSATGSGVILQTATFCTISGAFSNTIIPNKNEIYDKSYALNLLNCQSNNFTHIDLEVAYNGIKFDQWSIQNTFSAIFVANCDSNAATFDNSSQVTNGKNVVISIRSGSTLQAPSLAIAQKLFTTGSDSTKMKIENYFDY
ncbi:MAG: hypothetical protein SGJ10_09780 [Bacteroidota bacterium]|nr:hypothetical protein [Bacteroidota bacterium]